MTAWVITIDAAGPDAGPEFAEQLVDSLPSAAAAAGAGRVSVTFSISARSPAGAVKRGLEVWGSAVPDAGSGGQPDLAVVRVEVIAEAEHDAQLERPNFPVLLGVAELAERLGVSKARASELARLESFPRPVAQLASGPVWTTASVSGHLEGWQRKPGRPRKLEGKIGVKVTASGTLSVTPKEG